MFIFVIVEEFCREQAVIHIRFFEELVSFKRAIPNDLVVQNFFKDITMFITGRTPGGDFPWFLLYPPTKSVLKTNDSFEGSSTERTIRSNTQISVTDSSVIELMPFFHNTRAGLFPQATLAKLILNYPTFREKLLLYVDSLLILHHRAYYARHEMSVRSNFSMPLLLGGKEVDSFLDLMAEKNLIQVMDCSNIHSSCRGMLCPSLLFIVYSHIFYLY